MGLFSRLGRGAMRRAHNLTGMEEGVARARAQGMGWPEVADQVGVGRDMEDFLRARGGSAVDKLGAAGMKPDDLVPYQPSPMLTQMQNEVMRLARDGYSVEEISQALGVDARMVQERLMSAQARLGG